MAATVFCLRCWALACNAQHFVIHEEDDEADRLMIVANINSWADEQPPLLP